MTNLPNFYIVVADAPSERLEFQFIPDEVNTASTATIETAATPTRNNSRAIYFGGDDEVSFVISFFIETEQDKQEIVRKTEWLTSLRYDGRDVLCSLGSLLRNDPYTVKSVTTTYSLLDENGLPKQAKIELSLKLNPRQNLSFEDIRRY